MEWPLLGFVPPRGKSRRTSRRRRLFSYDAAVWLQKDSMTVHLVNLTDAMAMRPQMQGLSAPRNGSQWRGTCLDENSLYPAH